MRIQFYRLLDHPQLKEAEREAALLTGDRLIPTETAYTPLKCSDSPGKLPDLWGLKLATDSSIRWEILRVSGEGFLLIHFHPSGW